MSDLTCIVCHGTGKTYSGESCYKCDPLRVDAPMTQAPDLVATPNPTPADRLQEAIDALYGDANLINLATPRMKVVMDAARAHLADLRREKVIDRDAVKRARDELVSPVLTKRPNDGDEYDGYKMAAYLFIANHRDVLLALLNKEIAE
jgi:hypothetical protein